MRLTTTALTLVLAASLGCGSTSGGGGSKSNDAGEAASHDGLVEVETEGSGHLFLKPDHGIGGYDAIAVAPSFVSYRRTSARIDPEDEEIYLVSMEQAIIDAADSASIPVVNNVGKCVIKVGAGFVNVDLAQSDTADVLGRMTLVIEYQDSVSGQSLLRYFAEQYVKREAEGVSRSEQLSRSFDRMIDEVNIISAITSATVAPSDPRPGCNGDLVKARDQST
jgi:hypothetical protein